MKINSIQNNGTAPHFKKGLTSYEVNKVKNMHPLEHNSIAINLKKEFGLEADFNGCNTVAWCVNELVKIMKRAGFELPSKFSFAYFTNSDALGQYAPDTDTVYINSKYSAFTDLECQNKLEELQGTFHPKTKHFLQTYLHEFSHAAHFLNLRKRFGFDKAKTIMLGYLNNHSPQETLVEPIYSRFRMLLGKKVAGSIFPPSNGEYATNNLNEYFAEKNARKLAEQLGDNYNTSNIMESFAYTYIGHFSMDDANIFGSNQIPPAFLRSATLRNPFASDLNWINPVGYFAETIDNVKNLIKLFDGDVYNGKIEYIQGFTD